MKKCWIAVVSGVFVLGLCLKLSQTVSVSNTVGGRELPIYSVETDKKQVALSFDATWGNEYTQNILDILKKNNVHATFFVTGGWVEKYPDDVKRIQAAGHELGNHSERHQVMSQFSSEECREEIMKVHKKVKELTGIEMSVFRAPYGDYDDHVIKTAEECGYKTIQWSIDSLDWKDYGSENIIQNVLHHKELKSGAIILMHNGAKYTKEALETVISGIQEKGYEIVTISQMIYKDDYHLDVAGRQIKN